MVLASLSGSAKGTREGLALLTRPQASAEPASTKTRALQKAQVRRGSAGEVCADLLWEGIHIAGTEARVTGKGRYIEAWGGGLGGRMDGTGWAFVGGEGPPRNIFYPLKRFFLFAE